jgi:hypothetical protein
VVNAKAVKRGRPIADLAQDLFHLTGGWPRRVGDALFVVTPDHKAHWLTTPARLFAWARAQADVAWAGGPDLAPAAEFFHHLQMACQGYDNHSRNNHSGRPPAEEMRRPPLPPSGLRSNTSSLVAVATTAASRSSLDVRLDS